MSCEPESSLNSSERRLTRSASTSSGLLPAPARNASGYREYTADDVERLRLLIGLRQLDIPLEHAAELASMCAAGHCDEVSDELGALLTQKRHELARRI